MKNNIRRFPWFWLFYVLYILLLGGAIVYGLSQLWKFLTVYENTRPVHFMEDTLTIFQESETEEFQNYLTNTVENPYEDTDLLLSLFYDFIAGKELSFGKLSGSYTESHPVYAVLADDVHVATVSFTSDHTNAGYGLSGWTLEEITLLVTPTKSFAITVPSSMTVYINGIPAATEHIVSTVETDTPVSYVNYAFSGLYKEPDIRVTDRYGSEVTLQKDEATGGLYYKLAYASAPASMSLSFGGHVLDQGNILTKNIPVEKLSVITQTAVRFPEYAVLPELLTIPSFTEYYIDFAYTKDSVSFMDRFGTGHTPDYDPVTNSYSHGLVSDDSLKEECAAAATDFLETYALFCSDDASQTALEPFFPKNSAYYKLIISMDNHWFPAHSSVTFGNHELLNFFAYSENLVYIQMSIEEKMYIYYTGENKTILVNHPLWLVKMDGNWYVARMIFDDTATE
ncbi:MAG: hypothetical protein J6J42_13525 [Lachnospiraceae bacterium]|nr:hypothetical protein [Lachnospiraceae bacterium]